MVAEPKVLSVQKYESGPPVSTNTNGQIVSADGDTLAASKQEEWVTKKKTELITTKQIETRVKRQLVLEDGKVVEDSGPLVTTTTTEDTDKNESEHTEHKQHGDDAELGEGWVAVESVPDDAIVKETNERKITTHDEVQDILETEEVKHLGDVSNEKLVRAIREGSGDTRQALFSERNELVPLTQGEKDFSAQKRVVNKSRTHDRTTDIEDTNEISKLNEKGNLVTEISKRHEHEVFHNEDIPDSDSDEFEHIENREGSQDYSHSKNENYIEYLSVPKGSPVSKGVKVGEGARLVSENIKSERQGEDDLWDSVSERIRKEKSKGDKLYYSSNNKLGASRSDALTSRPLNIDQEESAKKNETNRWLNSHFGSSSSSLNSESSPRSPIRTTPTGIHVTMTSRSSPLHSTSSPPPPPPMPSMKSNKLYSSEHQSLGKRISFGDSPSPRPSPVPAKDVHFDLKHRHNDVLRSLNSQFGRSSVSKSGSPWDETPTPPPRTRRRNSPEMRNVHTPDYSSSPTTMDRNYTASLRPGNYQLQKSNDVGERKGYERKEQNFTYSGPGQNLNREAFESGNFGGSGYVTKQNNFYKTNETNNPAQTAAYENGDAEVSERKTVERRQQSFKYEGPTQKQFSPKYVLGTHTSQMNRLKGIEGTEDSSNAVALRSSQTLPRKKFYFGDEDGSILNKSSVTRTSESRRTGVDDINVSISNQYTGGTKGGSLNRSMSFTPKSISWDKGSRYTNDLAQANRTHSTYKSNPQLVDSPDLLSPKLINYIRNGTIPTNNTSTNLDRNRESFSNRYDTTNMSRSKRTFLENVRSNVSNDFLDPGRGASPSRSVTPNSPTARTIASRQLVSSPRRTTSPGLSDDYNETYRMSSSTPDNDPSKPKITTDTTSRFSRRTLLGSDGHPAGKIEATETTTRTKSRFKDSEITYPNGRRVGSPASFRTEPITKSSVIIPVKDTNNNKRVHYST